jgi:dynein heavy chain
VEAPRPEPRGREGDIILAAKSVAYPGPFTTDFRHSVVSAWSGKIQDAAIPRSPGGTITSILGAALRTLQWHLKQLPRDDLSFENAVVLTECRCWPLSIDPQGQAASFILSIEPDLLVLWTKENAFMRVPENAVSIGRPLLIEGIDRELERVLDPILSVVTRDKAV